VFEKRILPLMSQPERLVERAPPGHGFFLGVRRITTLPAVLSAVIVVFAALLAAGDYEVLRYIVDFDVAHEGWYVEETVITLFILGFAWMILAIQRSVLLRREIVWRKEAERQASLLARHDSLTGLPNRRVLIEAVSRALSAPNPTEPFAVMLLDLDGFKRVNNAHGHTAGDNLLSQMAERLKSVVGSRSLLAHFGGYEFAIMAEAGLNDAELARTAGRIVDSISEPFGLAQLSDIVASVGIAIAPRDASDADTVLRAAEIAMYRAKSAGRGTFRFFKQSMDVEVRDHAALKADLRQAVLTGQIVPYYQPLVDLRSRQVSGFEVLARWPHPTRGLLSPDKFIPLSEDLGLLSTITLSLLKTATRDTKSWAADCRISINISPEQAHEPDLLRLITDVILAAGVAPSRIEIEITEDAMIADLNTVRTFIGGLKSVGMTVALDDFGSGYSSLSHLHDLPFDKVKIDKSFILKLASDPSVIDYIGAIIGLGKSLHLEVTAEGIETPGVLEKLADLGCSFGQGYLFGKPVPAAEVPAELHRIAASQFMRETSA
jgi:diguanylate cyclase (GGDEF)-like protein